MKTNSAHRWEVSNTEERHLGIVLFLLAVVVGVGGCSMISGLLVVAAQPRYLVS